MNLDLKLIGFIIEDEVIGFFTNAPEIFLMIYF